MADCTRLNITDLHEDIIRHILENINISATDAVKFTNTCKQFRTMIKEDDSFWRHKFFLSWPSLIGVYDFELFGRDIDMKEEIIERMKCRKRLLRYFSELNEKYWDTEEIPSSSLQKFDPMFRDENGISMKFYYLLDDLISILKDWDAEKEVNLTHLYYCRKVFRHMKQCCLEDEWQKFKNLPSEQQVLERALVIAFQWCSNQNVSVSMLLAQLKPIVDQTMELLEEELFLTIPYAQLNFWRHNTIDQNQWDSERTKEVLRVIHHILYDKFKQINNLISKLQFAVTFHAIARTFGIRCEVLNAVPHFFLSWRESYDINNRAQYENNYFLNIFSEEFTMTRDNIVVDGEQYSLEELATSILTPTELMKICRNFMRHSLKRTRDRNPRQEFRHIINPQNMDTIFDLYNSFISSDLDIIDPADILKLSLGVLGSLMYNLERDQLFYILSPRAVMLWGKCCEPRLHLQMDCIFFLDDVHVHHASTSLGSFTRRVYNKMKTKFQFFHKVHRRDPSVKYAIGMIVRVKDSNSLGVICWWEIERYVQSMSHYRVATGSMPYFGLYLSYRVNYKVFTHIGKPQKVNQNILMALKTDMQEADTRRLLDNNMIGRYFSHFNHTHFTPNPVLEKMFPDDANFREQWLTDNLRSE